MMPQPCRLAAHNRMIARAVLLSLVLLLPASIAIAGELFAIEPLADGVYAAIPHLRANCNAVIVILDDGVLVVEAEATPSAARALIDQIKKLTQKPVKYVVNTHLHSDHTQGNEAFLRTWPTGTEIISTIATRANLERQGIARWHNEILAMPQEISKLKSDLKTAASVEQRDTLLRDIMEAEDYFKELKTVHFTLPTLTFDRSLILNGGSRRVEILWLGRAHTDGDALVYLPAEKILVTGDVLHGWTPTMRDSYPYEWIDTLDAAERLEFDTVVGGHGDVMHGKARFELWKEFLRDIMQRTAAAYADGDSMEDAKQRVSEAMIPLYADRLPRFRKFIAEDVAKAYQIVNFRN